MVKAYNLIIYGYFCTGFINFMLKDKSLIDFRNLLSPHNFKKNGEEFDIYFSDFRGTFLQLDNPLQFRLSKIKENEDFLIAEMSKALNK